MHAAKCISRPNSRERIETFSDALSTCSITVSPGPTAGSGLKRYDIADDMLHDDGISRPNSRERIETLHDSRECKLAMYVSPGPTAGSGLKHQDDRVAIEHR